MAEPFGSGSRRSRIRFQSGGSTCKRSNKRRVGSRSIGIITVLREQQPPTKKKCSTSKAGRGKAAQGHVDQEEIEEEDDDQNHPLQEQHHHQQQQQYFHSIEQQQHLYTRLDTEPPSTQNPPKKRSYFPSSSSTTLAEQNIEYARKMGESHHQTSSRLGLRSAGAGGGEIVEVQGGHIVRSTGRKDRHSKVCTAKGPRDRRVRLSAHTAIQFYDVQDRLGYDRPSKAVDWLIKKAKAAIDELAELPAWNPTATSASTATATATSAQEQQIRAHGVVDSVGGSSRRGAATTVVGDDSASGFTIQQHHQQHEPMESPHSDNNPSFLPASLDSDSIADTIKSFFPMGASAEAASSAAASLQFQHYPPDLLSRTSSQNQDLRLSLQFQDPMMLQSHHHQSQAQQAAEQAALFSGTTPLGFDAHSAGWSDQQPTEIGRFQRMVAWNAGADSGSGSGGFVFNSLPPPQSLQPLFGQTHFFSQRGPLQSSNTPSVRAWIDPPIAAQHHHQTPSIHQSTISGIGGFASGGGGFSGFRIPARIQGEEEEHDGISNKPSSASSDSRH
ncbi:hypothetical protein L1049_001075 [Liquidambar formosana]|uniref:TCP domain-containing protein n=1 Tax=Liquidambar formosana TaxID=63359 RepID=A0AAP0NDK7_LIQFO